MILQFRYGFNINGVPYGWHEKKLYRLPYTNKSNMNFELKEIKQIMVGNNVGYSFKGKRYTLKQLEQLTTAINYNYNQITDKDCPF